MLYDSFHSVTVLVFAEAILMFVFLAGAWSKARARETFEGVLQNYRLLPESTVLPLSYLLPLAEAAVALGLGYATTRPYAAAGAILLLAVFNVAIAVNLARGRREIDCGCFSAVLKQHLSGWLIVRNTVLMGLAAWVAGAPPSLVGMASWLDWIVGLAAAIAVAFVYVSASLLAILGESIRSSRHAG